MDWTPALLVAGRVVEVEEGIFQFPRRRSTKLFRRELGPRPQQGVEKSSCSANTGLPEQDKWRFCAELSYSARQSCIPSRALTTRDLDERHASRSSHL